MTIGNTRKSCALGIVGIVLNLVSQCGADDRCPSAGVCTSQSINERTLSSDLPCCDVALQADPDEIKKCVNKSAPFLEEQGGSTQAPFVLVLAHTTKSMKYGTLSAVLNGIWCRRVGIPFVLDVREGKFGTPTNVIVKTHWIGVARRKGVKWLFWIDSDAILLSQATKHDALRSAIKAYASDKTEILVAGQGGGNEPFNCGTVIMRCSGWMEEFLHIWEDDLLQNGGNDQSALDRLFKRDAYGVRQRLVVMPPQTLNSMLSDPVVGPDAMRQPLVHLAGHPHTLRVSVFTAVLEWTCHNRNVQVTNFSVLERAYENALIELDTHTYTAKLARHLKLRGRPREAEATFRQMHLDISEMMGANHVGALITQNNLAVHLHEQDRLDEAAHLYKGVVKGWRKHLGGETNSYLKTSLSSLRSLYVQRGDYFDDGPPLLTTTPDMTDDQLVEINSLAQQLMQQGRGKESEKHLRAALKKAEKTLGFKNRNVLLSYYNLATLLQSRRKFAEVAPLYRRAFEGQEALLGLNHEDTFYTDKSLMEFFVSQGRRSEAEALQSRTGFMQELTGMAHMSSRLMNSWKPDESEQVLRKAIEFGKSKFGKNSPTVLTLGYNLAASMFFRKRYNEAWSEFRWTLEGQMKMLDSNSEDLAATLTLFSHALGGYHQPGSHGSTSVTETHSASDSTLALPPLGEH